MKVFGGGARGLNPGGKSYEGERPPPPPWVIEDGSPGTVTVVLFIVTYGMNL